MKNRTLLRGDVIVCILAFILPRFFVMFRYPIFNDEAIYVRYGKIMGQSGQHFYSLAVIGKQPLMYWLYWLSSTIIYDPLIAGRLVSFLSSCATLILVYAIVHMLSGHKASMTAAFFYAITPLAVFFDSLAVVDSTLTMLFTLICYELILLMSKFSLRAVAVLGVSLGIACWIKTTAVLFMITIGFAFLFLHAKKKMTFVQMVISCMSICSIISIFLVPLIMRPEFKTLLQFQSEYGLTLRELFALPFKTWLRNLVSILLVYGGYASPILFVIAVYGYWKKRKENQTGLLILLTVIPVLFLIFVARSLHGRYVYFTFIPVLIMSAVILQKSRFLRNLTMACMFFLTCLLSWDARIYFHLFPSISVYAAESYQYADGWPSGYGVREALNFVNRHRMGKNAFVGVRWDSGNPEDTILVYAPKYPGLLSDFFDPKLESFPSIYKLTMNMPVYLITRNGQRAGLDAYLSMIKSFPKPRGGESVEVYTFIRPK